MTVVKTVAETRVLLELLVYYCIVIAIVAIHRPEAGLRKPEICRGYPFRKTQGKRNTWGVTW